MNFRTGVHHGIPIALGYFSVATAFGLIAVNGGCTAVEALFISMFNVTSAGQFAGVTVMASAGSYIEMAMTQFLINARYSLMAISLSQRVDSRFTTLPRILLSTFITDEIYAVAIGQKEDVSAKYYAGLSCLPYVGWAAGTFFGAFMGNILPQVLTTSLSIGLYGMFIAIVVPVVKSSRKTLIIVGISLAISCLLYFIPAFDKVSAGFAIIISAVIASAAGALLFPIDDEEVTE
ncbi:MAG: AzlC family ABC transporter permease [Lentihominibacter sp.]|nr:AzlC family ABC transporter permease [Lentihominibacter sp.]